jgi:hypothetical protein
MTKRPLRARDLLDEWHNSTHYNRSSQISATLRIRSMADTFMRQDMVSLYDLDVYKSTIVSSKSWTTTQFRKENKRTDHAIPATHTVTN